MRHYEDAPPLLNQQVKAYIIPISKICFFKNLVLEIGFIFISLFKTFYGSKKNRKVTYF